MDEFVYVNGNNCHAENDDDGTTRNDIDECAYPTTCDDGAKCTNTVGSVSCSYGSGFTGSDIEDDPCVGIDDCGDNDGSTNSRYVNTDGSFE